MKNLLTALFFIPVFAFAQTTHTVAAKESLYSISRQYNMHPREIAAYNNISIDKGLTIGQVIKIPAKSTMAALPKLPVEKTEPTTKQVQKITPVEKIVPETKSAEKITIAKNELVPVYHKVEKKETLYHISSLYHKVAVADLKKWNNLSGDGLTEGTNLIVGYRKKTIADAINKATDIETRSGDGDLVIKAAPEERKAVVSDVVIKELPTPVEMEPVKTAPVQITKEESNASTGTKFNGGFFKSAYSSQTSGKANLAEETGTAAIFKTTSGWEDGKYYCLHNTAPAGSIVKITNNNNQKAIYAKVLDVIPDLKQNNGILVRLSNAAADELGTGTDNFECTINF